MALPQTQTFYYNGVSFNATNKSSWKCTPIYSPAGTTVKWIEYRVETVGYITLGTGGNFDAGMADLRRRLTKPGQTFRYFGQGLGGQTNGNEEAIAINDDASGVWDVCWGPRPELIEWTTLGPTGAAKLVWACTFRIPECDSGSVLYKNGIIYREFSIDHAINSDGESRVTYSGQLEIAMTHSGAAGRVPHNIEDFRFRCVPELQNGYRREQDFKISEDRRRMDFTVTDTEIPVPLPDGLSHAEVKHEVRWSMAAGATTLLGTISGSLRVPSGVGRAEMADRFFALVISRLSTTAQAFGRPLFRGPGARPRVVANPNAGGGLFGMIHFDRVEAGGGGNTIIVTDVRAAEEIFGRGGDFSVTYRAVGAGLDQIFSHSGMWRAVPGTDFDSWRQSVALTAHSPTGGRGLFYDTSRDVLIDLCYRGPAPRTPPPRGGGDKKPALPKARDKKRPGPRGAELGTFIARPPEPVSEWDRLHFGPSAPLPAGMPGNPQTVRSQRGGGPPVNPGRSWLAYHCEVELEEDMRLARHSPLGGDVLVSDRGADAADLGAVARDRGGYRRPVSGSAKDIIQRCGGPEATVYLVGSAQRLGYRIAPPRLVAVGGMRPELAWHRFREGTAAAPGGHVINAAEWVQCYFLEQSPKSLPLPANPALGTQGAR